MADHHDGIDGSSDAQPVPADAIKAAASFSNKKRSMEGQQPLSSGQKTPRRASNGSNLDDSSSWDELQTVNMREKCRIDESADATVAPGKSINEAGGGIAAISHDPLAAAAKPPPPRPHKIDVSASFVDDGDDEMLANGRRSRIVQNPVTTQSPNEPNSRACGGQPVRCPRCDSQETKYCYNNNYNAKQPRYYCKVRFLNIQCLLTNRPSLQRGVCLCLEDSWRRCHHITCSPSCCETTRNESHIYILFCRSRSCSLHISVWLTEACFTSICLSVCPSICLSVRLPAGSRLICAVNSIVSSSPTTLWGSLASRVQACHRYWTLGGTLRNVPVGAGRRRNKSRGASSGVSPRSKESLLPRKSSERPQRLSGGVDFGAMGCSGLGSGGASPQLGQVSPTTPSSLAMSISNSRWNVDKGISSADRSIMPASGAPAAAHASIGPHPCGTAAAITPSPSSTHFPSSASTAAATAAAAAAAAAAVAHSQYGGGPIVSAASTPYSSASHGATPYAMDDAISSAAWYIGAQLAVATATAFAAGGLSPSDSIHVVMQQQKQQQQHQQQQASNVSSPTAAAAAATVAAAADLAMRGACMPMMPLLLQSSMPGTPVPSPTSPASPVVGRQALTAASHFQYPQLPHQIQWRHQHQQNVQKKQQHSRGPLSGSAKDRQKAQYDAPNSSSGRR